MIYGSVARGTEDVTSDVDLLVIGDVEPAGLDALLFRAERLLEREANATILTKAEWRDRVDRPGCGLKSADDAGKRAA